MAAMYSFNPKARFKLNALYHRHASIALSFAISLHFTVIIIYYCVAIMSTPSPKSTEGIGDDSKKDTIIQIYEPHREGGAGNDKFLSRSVHITSASIGSVISIPINIDDNNILRLVDPTVNDEPNNAKDSGGGGVPGIGDDVPEGGGVSDIYDPIIDLAEGFHPMEQYPKAIKQVSPEYPELARLVGVEGNVSIKLLINKEGKPKEARIVSSDSEIFNDAAKQAALQWTFIPAVMNQRTVSVWVIVPFHFTLHR